MPDIFQVFPVFDIDQRFYLRAPSLDSGDAESSLECYNDPKVNAFVPDDCIPCNIEASRRNIQYMIDLFNNKQSFYWMIARRDNDVSIGKIGFHAWHHFHNRLEISYQIKSEYWNRGIITRALHVIVDFGFNCMKVERIEANTIVNNYASIRVLQKTGFAIEGILRSYRFYKGQNVDIVVLGHTKRQYYAIPKHHTISTLRYPTRHCNNIYSNDYNIITNDP